MRGATAALRAVRNEFPSIRSAWLPSLTLAWFGSHKICVSILTPLQTPGAARTFARPHLPRSGVSRSHLSRAGRVEPTLRPRLPSAGRIRPSPRSCLWRRWLAAPRLSSRARAPLVTTHQVPHSKARLLSAFDQAALVHKPGAALPMQVPRCAGWMRPGTLIPLYCRASDP